jgi:two-component system CheB/CheR fusion protein
MYFNGESQAKIMSRFYLALAEGGVLVLGKAERMSGYARAFVPVDLKRRMFSRGPLSGRPVTACCSWRRPGTTRPSGS